MQKTKITFLISKNFSQTMFSSKIYAFPYTENKSKEFCYLRYVFLYPLAV